MNFANFDGNKNLKAELLSLEQSHRFPHALILNGSDSETRDKLTLLLSKWAVCKSEQKPCSECIPCQKAEKGVHPDIYFAKGSGKTDTVSVDEIRNITRACSIIANEADTKVFVIKDADKRMGVEALNAFLKTLEEPPQAILFILTTEDSGTLPETVLSRCTVLNLEQSIVFSEESLELAHKILLSITETSELNLLKNTNALSDKTVALEVLPAMRAILSDALSLTVCDETLLSKDLSEVLSTKLTKKKIIGLIETINHAIYTINRNVNLSLMSTWICGEFRRISWQK
ncbi:MAG: hypothetical protein IKK10_03020 [Clostridia bacterium]|nr:hypothetical protein [Clostridia bacterium]